MKQTMAMQTIKTTMPAIEPAIAATGAECFNGAFGGIPGKLEF